MKKNIPIAIAAGIGILAIVSVLLIIPQESNVAEVEDTLDREILPVDIPEIQEKLDRDSRVSDQVVVKPAKTASLLGMIGERLEAVSRSFHKPHSETA